MKIGLDVGLFQEQRLVLKQGFRKICPKCGSDNDIGKCSLACMNIINSSRNSIIAVPLCQDCGQNLWEKEHEFKSYLDKEYNRAKIKQLKKEGKWHKTKW